MILSSVRDYLRLHGQASLAELAMAVNADRDTVRAMVDVWVRKGQATRLPAANGCGANCRQCDSAQAEIYAWGDPQQAATDVASCAPR